MQLREIHIDGFGVFCNRHITGLSKGTNVLFGLNEFGKSTLLEFIRQVTFGFPTASNSSYYPPIAGGAYGGRIVCELENGKTLTISRKEGRSGGNVKILADYKEYSGNEELKKYLGSVTKKFYENVYAFSLDELQEAKTLDEEDIREHIYGAGLGLGKISLKKINDDLSKKAEAVFKSGGSTQEIPKLYKEILEKGKNILEAKKLLAEYDKLNTEVRELEEKISLLSSQILALDGDKRKLQSQKDLFPAYITLIEAEQKLAGIPETPLFVENADVELGKRVSVSTSLEKQIKGEGDQLKELEQRRDRLSYNSNLLETESSINSLQKKISQFKDAVRDIDSVLGEKTACIEDIRLSIMRLGPNWSQETVRDFNPTLLHEDWIRTAKENMHESKRSIDSINSKLEAYRDRKTEESSKSAVIPFSIRAAGYASVFFGIIGIVAGILVSQLALSVFSVILLSVGLVILFSQRGSKNIPASDQLELKYINDLSAAEKGQKIHLDEWKGKLKSFNIDNNLSPDGFIEITRSVREIQSKQTSLAKLNSRILAMQNAIDEVHNQYNRIMASIGDAENAHNSLTAGDLEALARKLDASKEAKREKQGLNDEIERRQAAIKRDSESLDSAKRSVQEYLSSFGTKDETDFKKQYELFLIRKQLEAKAETSRRTIQLVVGNLDNYKKFITSVSEMDPVMIDAALNAAESQLQGMNEERIGIDRQIGQLQEKLKGLSSMDLTTEQIELEIKKQLLMDYSGEWVRALIGKFVLEKAISKYENTRQPDVIKAAADVFTSITNNAYTLIVKPTDSNELKIQDATANRKSVSQMSRGTREQLYLSMRLGLIKVYETESEPMPIIMDDILANFDDKRGLAAIKGLIGFSIDRQAIVFTCHKSSLDSYKRLGAKEITVN